MIAAAAAASIASARVRVRRRLATANASAANERGASPESEPDDSRRSSSVSRRSFSASTFPMDATRQSVGARSRSDASSGEFRILVAFGDAYGVLSSPPTANPANPSRDPTLNDPPALAPSSPPSAGFRMNADAPTRSAVFLGVVGSSRTNATARSAARASSLARLANAPDPDPDEDEDEDDDRNRDVPGSIPGSVSSRRCPGRCPGRAPVRSKPLRGSFRRRGSGVSVPRWTNASRETPAATAAAIAF